MRFAGILPSHTQLIRSHTIHRSNLCPLLSPAPLYARIPLKRLRYLLSRDPAAAGPSRDPALYVAPVDRGDGVDLHLEPLSFFELLFTPECEPARLFVIQSVRYDGSSIIFFIIFFILISTFI